MYYVIEAIITITVTWYITSLCWVRTMLNEKSEEWHSAWNAGINHVLDMGHAERVALRNYRKSQSENDDNGVP